MSVVNLSVKNPVTIHLITLLIFIVGISAYVGMNREEYPEVSFGMISVTTVYPGVSPEEIEKLVTQPLEDEVYDVDGLVRIASTSSEGLSVLVAEFEPDLKDLDKALRDVQTAVGKVDLPAGAKTPEVKEMVYPVPVITVALSGDAEEDQIKEIGEDLKKRLSEIEGVHLITTAGIREREIWVEVDPNRLSSYGLSMASVIHSIAVANLSIPGGAIPVGRSEFIVRTIGEFDEVEDVRNVIIRPHGSGQHVRVKDIAEVRETYEERRSDARLNGQKALMLTVQKTADGNAVRIVEAVKEWVRIFERRLPAGARLSLHNDGSARIKEALSELQRNGWMGMILVFFVLWAFIGWRNAIMAALGIPTSLLIAVILMKATGMTINMLSLFSMIVVLGMLVDDAIVLIENIHRYIEEGLPPAEAAMVGAREVIRPVVSSTATTLAAFLPLLIMTGLLGKFFSIIPKVVTFALLGSLFEAVVILPSHMADFSKRPSPGGTTDRRGKEGWLGKVRRLYIYILMKTLRHRYWTAIGVILAAAVSLGVGAFFMRFTLFAETEIEAFQVRVQAPIGVTLEETSRILSEVEAEALSLPKTEVQSVITQAGLMQQELGVTFGKHLGMITVNLAKPGARKRPGEAVMDDLRKRCRDIAGATSIEFVKVEDRPPVGKPVAVRIEGDDFGILRDLAEQVKAYLRTLKGTKDIKDDFEEGAEEISIYVNGDRASLYGLNSSVVAAAVRNAFEGGVATKIRRGEEEIDVIAKYKAAYRRNISDIRNLTIQSPAGPLVPLKNVARIEQRKGFAGIRRINRKRVVTITADIVPQVTTSSMINKAIRERFRDVEVTHRGYRMVFGGEYEETQKSIVSLLKAFGLAVLIIYIILASQFKSFVQPFVVICAVPFSFIGVVLGLFFSGEAFGLISTIGIIALSGIVVNDSLVLVDFIRSAREKGVGKWESIVEAGRTRFRPIILTSVTTIFGLLPMATGLGGTKGMLKPMAIAIVWGLAFATVLTLIVVPALFSILDDLHSLLRRSPSPADDSGARRERGDADR